jgi:hypothetical protein
MNPRSRMSVWTLRLLCMSIGGQRMDEKEADDGEQI